MGSLRGTRVNSREVNSVEQHSICRLKVLDLHDTICTPHNSRDLSLLVAFPFLFMPSVCSCLLPKATPGDMI